MAVPNEGLTTEQELAIIQAYGDPTKTVVVIAKEAGVSKVTVYEVIRRTGTPLRQPEQKREKLSPAQVRRAKQIVEAVALKKLRWHIDDIAEELGVTVGTAYGYLRAARKETVDGLSA